MQKASNSFFIQLFLDTFHFHPFDMQLQFCRLFPWSTESVPCCDSICPNQARSMSRTIMGESALRSHQMFQVFLAFISLV